MRLVVLESSNIVEIDYTAAGVLAEVVRKCRADGLDLAVALLESIRAQASFRDFGLMNLIGADHMFRSVGEALRALGGGRLAD